MIGTLDKLEPSERRAAKPIASQLKNHPSKGVGAHRRGHKEDLVADGGQHNGMRRLAKNTKQETWGRVWMKPLKISTYAERQDNQIYKSNTLEIPAKDKNRTRWCLTTRVQGVFPLFHVFLLYLFVSFLLSLLEKPIKWHVRLPCCLYSFHLHFLSSCSTKKPLKPAFFLAKLLPKEGKKLPSQIERLRENDESVVVGQASIR